MCATREISGPVATLLLVAPTWGVHIMADTPLTLMAVHAHPDDEVLGGGGTLACYAAAGQRVVLVTCTDGAVGEIVDPAIATPETLAEVRAEELRAACALLGITSQHF